MHWQGKYSLTACSIQLWFCRFYLRTSLVFTLYIYYVFAAEQLPHFALLFNMGQWAFKSRLKTCDACFYSLLSCVGHSFFHLLLLHGCLILKLLFGRPYYRSSLWYTMSSVCLSVCRLSVCDVLYCGKTVRPSEKVSEGVNRKPGSKSSFLGSPPYFYFGFAATANKTAVFALFLLI